MNDLSHQDLQRLVAALDTLHQDFDPQTLTERTLAAAGQIISADSVAFTGFRCGGEYAGLMWTNVREYSPAEMQAFAAYIHENPLFDEFILKRRTETLKITDVTPPDEFRRTAIYNEFYRRVGVSNQLVAPLQVSDDLLITCSINIEKKDFSERDKTALTLLAPHLANAIRNAFAYQRLSGALDQEACGIVALNSNGKPVFISEYARRLFEKYFASEKCRADALPASLGDWIEKTNSSVRANEFDQPPAPLKMVNQNGEMTARLGFNRQTDERTLLLEEKRFASAQTYARLGLTKREAEILFWIANGKTDDAIATLCGISLRTVHKHVEHIYTKIGVETRTGAMLKAFEANQPGTH